MQFTRLVVHKEFTESVSTPGERGEAHLVLVVVGDGEARGVLGLGPLAERGEHAPHEPALVPAEVEPGDRRGGGQEEHGGEEGGAARRHRKLAASLTYHQPVGLVRVGVWCLAAAAAAAAILCPAARARALASLGRVGKASPSRVWWWWGQVGVEATATRDPIGAVSASGSGGGVGTGSPDAEAGLSSSGLWAEPNCPSVSARSFVSGGATASRHCVVHLSSTRGPLLAHPKLPVN
jgi:hypothetical protein